MSLILEALRKLDRDKQAPERGLVVTGATTWARAEERRGLRLVAIVAAGLVLGAGVWLWRGRAAHTPATSAAAGAGAASHATPAHEPADLRLAPRGVRSGEAPLGATTAAAGAPPAQPSPTQLLTPGASPADTAGTRALTPARAGTEVTGGGAEADDVRASRALPPAGVAVADTPADDGPRPVTPDDDDDAAGTSDEPGRVRPTIPPLDTERERAAARPADTPPEPAADVVLQAVTERDGRPLAIVNGRLVREGDSFDGIRILRIGSSEIEVEVKGKRRTVGF